MSRENIVWFAGLFEGEGSVRGYYRKKGGYYCPSLTVEMTDKDIIERVMNIFPFMSMYEHSSRKENWKATYEAYTGKREYVQAICVMIYPWLGERRKAQVTDVIANMYPKK